MRDAFVDFAPVLLPPDADLTTAMKCMTENAISIVLVVDDHRCLMGVVVDGDIRRALLRQPQLDQQLKSIMTVAPRTAPNDLDEADLHALAEQAASPWLPLVDKQGVVRGLVDLVTLRQQHRQLPNAAVLMAGGSGRRLMPHTEDTPKPLMPVGGRPILETLIRVLAGHGFERFYLSINYLGERIEAHFGDGAAFGVKIDYLREDRPLGTAGSLRQIAGREEAPVLVMNGDVLTRVNPRALLEFHCQEGAAATIAVREHCVEIPYGVVDTDGHRLTGLREKPEHKVFINAGIYVIEPGQFSLIPDGSAFDMPDLLTRIAASEAGGGVACFPLPEYWVDIGRVKDLEQARREFDSHF